MQNDQEFVFVCRMWGREENNIVRWEEEVGETGEGMEWDILQLKCDSCGFEKVTAKHTVLIAEKFKKNLCLD